MKTFILYLFAILPVLMITWIAYHPERAGWVHWIFIMLCFVVKSRIIRDSFDNFDKANVARETKVINDFLSQ